MHIGIDFDNTIVTYDNVFYEHAVKLGLIDKSVSKNKKQIRDEIRKLPNGKQAEIIGEVKEERPGLVLSKTIVGGHRIIEKPIGEQIPRVC